MVSIPNGYAQLNLKFGGTGLRYPAEVTLGLDVQAVTDPIGTLAADIDVLAENFWNHNAFSSAVSYQGLRLKYGPSSTGPAVEVTSSTPGTGGAGASSQVAYLIRKQTALGGRAGRGRMYLPGVTEAALGSDGIIDGTIATNINSWLVTFFNGIVANLATPVVLHGPDSPLSTPTPIVSVTIDGVGATQRRRLRR